MRGEGRHPRNSGGPLEYRGPLRPGGWARGQVDLEMLDAPVWVWQADQSYLTNTRGSSEIRRYISRGGITEAHVEGTHFESMQFPCVNALAELFAKALAASETMAIDTTPIQAAM